MHKTVRERSIPTTVVRGNIFFSICQFNVPSYFDIIVKSTGMNCTKRNITNTTPYIDVPDIPE